MANTPSLRIRLLDVHQDPLGQPCTIRLRHQTSGVLTVANSPVKKSIVVPDLVPGVYQVQVDPASYRAVGGFVDVRQSGVTDLDLDFPVDPGKVVDVIFPTFKKLIADGQRILNDTDALFGYEHLTGNALYTHLDDDSVKKAGLLNILTKTSVVAFANQRTVSSYIQRVLELRGDRFFAVVDKGLREETKNSVHDGLFHEVPAGLHHPPAGFDHAGSYKTHDHYGNLQLTFFTDGTAWQADIDIDDAAGLQHVFQVLRNTVTNQPTHPYDIHEILIAFQKLDPGYSLDV